MTLDKMFDNHNYWNNYFLKDIQSLLLFFLTHNYLLEYIRTTEDPTPEMIKQQLDILLEDYLTLESASVGVKDPDPRVTPTPDPTTAPQTDDDPMAGFTIATR